MFVQTYNFKRLKLRFGAKIVLGLVRYDFSVLICTFDFYCLNFFVLFLNKK